MKLNSTIDHGLLPSGSDESRHWFFANSDGLHLFVSDEQGNANDTRTEHYHNDGDGWKLHDSINNIVIQDITQLDEHSFGILGHNLVNGGMGLLISRNTDPSGTRGIENYKVASDINLDTIFWWREYFLRRD